MELPTLLLIFAVYAAWLAIIFAYARWLVASEVGVIIPMSAVIALPLAALAIARYLAAYTPLAFWTLAFALVAALGTVAFAAARHAWIAMKVKPAVALRSRGIC